MAAKQMPADTAFRDAAGRDISELTDRLGHPLRVAQLPIDSIRAEARLRESNPESVKQLGASVRDIGLRTPITVRPIGVGEYELVAGFNRLQAARLAGKSEIECFVVHLDEEGAELWELSENLFRQDLTKLERAEHFHRYVEILGQKVSSQLGTKDRTGPGRPPSGINAAARELGMTKSVAHRGYQIAQLTPEAKRVARSLELDDNEGALIKAAQAQPAKQPEALTALAAGRKRKRDEANSSPDQAALVRSGDARQQEPVPDALDVDADAAWLAGMLTLWNRGSRAQQARFLAAIGGAELSDPPSVSPEAFKETRSQAEAPIEEAAESVSERAEPDPLPSDELPGSSPGLKVEDDPKPGAGSSAGRQDTLCRIPRGAPISTLVKPGRVLIGKDGRRWRVQELIGPHFQLFAGGRWEHWVILAHPESTASVGARKGKGRDPDYLSEIVAVDGVLMSLHPSRGLEFRIDQLASGASTEGNPAHWKAGPDADEVGPVTSEPQEAGR